MIDLPDKAIEATARAMYEQRPQASDPVHWETPWDEVPEKWKAGQARAAISVLTAALPHIEKAIRAQAAADLWECWDACGDLIDDRDSARQAIDAIAAQIAKGAGE